ncbi:hypothetical protein C6H88_01400 [Chlamydia muridarum str. Nigg]|nr:hypothetical protein [Chlamydia muridarum]UFT32684.1 hypothetical protein FTN61_01510 [Chlamydia trachomatis]AHH22658.1 hypothetical protein TAC_01405 [Chlamydia muridarum str. Nigg3 CMUT3-5]AHH23582.1 hypothetical protein Y015_01405 [Chlamydia muridarum str. Nigg CM972]AID37804.1 hypothetical protein BB17_01440 [Chlamydia muridarum str. Nigg 2 MCR]AIT90476.1 hypothetical protein NC80_01340 [Chlamydia muridarum]
MGIKGVGGSGHSDYPIPSHNGDGESEKNSSDSTSSKVNAKVTSSLQGAPSTNDENSVSPYSVVDVTDLIESGESSRHVIKKSIETEEAAHRESSVEGAGHSSRGIFGRLQAGLGRLARRVGEAVRNTVGSIFPQRAGAEQRTGKARTKYSPSASRGLRLMFTDFWRYRVLHRNPPMDGLFAKLDADEAEDMAAYTKEYVSNLEKRGAADRETIEHCQMVAKNWEKRARDLRDMGAAKKFLRDPFGKSDPKYKGTLPGEYTVGNTMFYDGPGVSKLSEVDTGFWLDMEKLSDAVLSANIQKGLRARFVLNQSIPQLESLEERFRKLESACDEARASLKEAGWIKEGKEPNKAQRAFRRFVEESRNLELSFGSFGESARRLSARVSQGLAAAGEAIRRCFDCRKGKYSLKKDLSSEELNLAEELIRFTDEMGIERDPDGNYNIPWVENWRTGVPVIEGEGAEHIYETMMPVQESFEQVYEVMDMGLEERRDFAVSQQHYQVPPRSSLNYETPRFREYDVPRNSARSYYDVPRVPPQNEVEEMHVTKGMRSSVYACFVAGMRNYIVSQPQEQIPNSEQVEQLFQELINDGDQIIQELMKIWNEELDNQ